MGSPLSFESRDDPVPLTEEEQDVLAFAASGITGYALNDLTLGAGQGGSMMSGLVGRTVSSADAVQAVALLVTDDSEAWLVRRPQDLAVESGSSRSWPPAPAGVRPLGVRPSARPR